MCTELELKKEEDDADYFLAVIEEAKKYGLEREFVIFFMKYFLQCKEVVEASNCARGEWDF